MCIALNKVKYYFNHYHLPSWIISNNKNNFLYKKTFSYCMMFMRAAKVDMCVMFLFLKDSFFFFFCRLRDGRSPVSAV